jgi:imidazolonepropionase-like amidohydrolase
MGLQKTPGSITVGKTANLMVTKAFNHMNELPYWFAQNHCEKTFKVK